MWSFRKEIHKISHFPIPNTPAFVPCSETYNVSGSEGVYFLDIDLGTDWGIFSVAYNMQNVPDRLQIVNGGVVVADTKYVGDGLVGTPPNYDYAGMVGSNYNGIPEYIWDGTQFQTSGGTYDIYVPQSDVADNVTYPTDGNGMLYFLKDPSVVPSIVTLIITSPISGTLFDLETFCLTGKYQGNAVPVFLGYDLTTPATACTNFDYNGIGIPSSQIFYMYADVATLFTLADAVSLHPTSDVATNAPAGYYSDGQTVRFWDGNSFTSTASC